jgi:hypothetical protein
MLGTCKTCRWWNRDDHETEWVRDKQDSIPIAQRRCECPKIVDMSGSSASDLPQWRDLTSDAAGYTDREGYGAHFRTGPDFGCIHWEEKV